MAGSDVTLTEVIATDLSTLSGARGIWSGSSTGGRSGGALPAGIAVLVDKTIARRYRGGKPRNYLPYGTQTDLNGATGWSSSFQSAFNTSYGNFLSNFPSEAVGTATLVAEVNVSYYSGFASVQNPVTLRWKNIPKPRVTPQVDPITSWSMNPNYSSQRRRQRVVG
jgi:hypothetical protein